MEAPDSDLERLLRDLGPHGDLIRSRQTEHGIFAMDDLVGLSEDDLKEFNWPLPTRRAVIRQLAIYAAQQQQQEEVPQPVAIAAPAVAKQPVVAKTTRKQATAAPASTPATSPLNPTLRRLYVGFLPQNVSQNQLTTTFRRFGWVESVVILSKPGVATNFAFVIFRDPEAAERAHNAMNHSTCFGGRLSTNIKPVKSGQHHKHQQQQQQHQHQQHPQPHQKQHQQPKAKANKAGPNMTQPKPKPTSTPTPKAKAPNAIAKAASPASQTSPANAPAATPQSMPAKSVALGPESTATATTATATPTTAKATTATTTTQPSPCQAELSMLKHEVQLDPLTIRALACTDYLRTVLQGKHSNVRMHFHESRSAVIMQSIQQEAIDHALHTLRNGLDSFVNVSMRLDLSETKYAFKYIDRLSDRLEKLGVASDLLEAEMTLQMLAADGEKLALAQDSINQFFEERQASDYLEVSVAEANFLHQHRWDDIMAKKQQSKIDLFYLPPVVYREGVGFVWAVASDDKKAPAKPKPGKAGSESKQERVNNQAKATAHIVKQFDPPKPANDANKHLCVQGPKRGIDTLFETIRGMLNGFIMRQATIPVANILAFMTLRTLEQGRKKLAGGDNSDVLVSTVLKRGQDKQEIGINAWGVDEKAVEAAIAELQQMGSAVVNDVMRVDKTEAGILTTSLMGNKQQKFEAQWNVQVRINDATGEVHILGATQECANNARDALQGLIIHKRIDLEQTTYEGIERALLNCPDLKQDIIEIGKKKGGSVYVKIIPKGYQTVIELKGPKSALQDVRALIKHAIDKQKKLAVNQIKMLQPHEFRLLLRNNKQLLREIERGNNTAISWDGANTKQAKTGENTTLFEHTFANGAKLELGFGDIIHEKVQAIVNSANTELKHSAGIAAVIAKHAGPALIKECADWITHSGQVSIGTVAVTTAGQLTQFTHVIHVVGPQWKDGRSGEDEVLMAAAEAIYEAANQYGISSITVPAISSGIYGGNTERVALILVGSAISVLDATPAAASLKRIRFCMNDRAKALAFLKTMRELCQTPRQVKTQQTKTEKMWQWSWLDDDKTWKNYDPDQNTQIEKCYDAWIATQNATHAYATVTVTGDLKGVQNHSTYAIDMMDMMQSNTKTGYARKIQRQEVTVAALPDVIPYGQNNDDEDEDEDEDDDTAALMLRKGVTKITVSGLPNNVNNAIKRIDATIAQFIKQVKVKLDQPLPEASILSLQRQAARINVQFYANPKRIVLKGLSEDMSEIQSSIISAISKACQTVVYPDEWEHHKSGLLIDVARGTGEWQKVISRINFSTHTVERIQRVQNKTLWERYSTERARVARKNNQQPNERELFHGTRATDPSAIYGSEVGFDMRFSASGMWGQGIYFAVNATYSHNYVYSGLGNNKRQFFLARVVTGDAAKLQPNSALRKPPPKATLSASGIQEEHDSIMGHTNGSDVFILYHNCMAYPSYLITYVA